MTGQVVDERTDEGAEGWLVRLTCRGVRYETRSDGAGSWALRIPDGEDAANLWVHSTSSWRWRCPTPNARLFGRWLTPAERTGEEPLRIEVAERLARPIHGVAVDAETGAPLPHFRFSVREGAIRPKVTALVTDESGRFVSAESVRGGNVKVQAGPGEGRPDLAEFDLIHDGEPLTIAFHAGPWIDLALVGHVPERLEDLRFIVVRRGQAKPCAATHLRIAPNGDLWVRPPLGRERPAPSELVSLFVGDKVGHHLGHLDVTWADLIDAPDGPPLVFPMELTGALQVSTAYGDATEPGEREFSFRPSGDRIRVRIDMPGASFPGVRWRLAAGKWLPPGEALVHAAARAHVPADCAVEIVPGTTREVSLALAPAADLRRIRGRVRMSSGAPFDRAGVTIALRDDPSSSWRVSWERDRTCGTGLDHFMTEEVRDGVPMACFEIDSVPPGPLDVTAEHWSSPCTVEVHEEASGDVEIDVVIVLDVENLHRFGVRAVDAETGELLSVVPTTRVRDGGPAIPRRFGGMSFGNPRAREFDWAVHRAGWRPAYGTERDFQRDAEGKFWAEVVLEKGWGTRLEVVGPDGAPVAGAAVLLDGRETGHTNVAGELELSSGTKPYGIEVRAPHGEVLVLESGHAAWQTARMRGH